MTIADRVVGATKPDVPCAHWRGGIAEDLAPDGSYLSIAGHRKQAALEWGILGFGP